MYRKVLCFALMLLTAFSVCLAYAEEADASGERFSLRGGVMFGMAPDEVISIEASNGFQHDLTSSGDVLYKTDDNYQLYFQEHDIGTLGKMPIFRFEYDFDLVNKKMYQFYYVFRQEGAYEYLLPALTGKYGAPAADCSLYTEEFLGMKDNYLLDHSCWVLEYADETIVIDLWYNSFGTCFLAYQAHESKMALAEQASLDFGL